MFYNFWSKKQVSNAKIALKAQLKQCFLPATAVEKLSDLACFAGSLKLF
jgi:hypothetical protein